VSGEAPLRGAVVLDLSSGIAGGYCTKILADGGAEIIKTEAPEGDALRHWASGRPLGDGEDGALFEFLGCSKRSVVIDPDDSADVALLRSLLQAADMVVWTPVSRLADHPSFSPPAIRELAPGAVVAAITNFGLEGPWAGLPATEFTLQAWGGGIAGRGWPSRPPIHCGGRPGLWLGGLFAAVGLLAAWPRSRQTGAGELLDVSTLESLALCLQMYPLTARSMALTDTPRAPSGASRSVIIPGVEETTDGWVGFMVATAAMWESFCVMIEHPEWLDDQSLYAYAGRVARREEVEAAIRDWVGRRTAEEVLEMASLLRVPAAPVGNGATVTGFDHLVERRFYVPNPRTGVQQPDVPYTLGSGAARRDFEAAPPLGEATQAERSAPRRPKPVAPPGEAPAPLPFAGIRVADFTAFWAGPIVGQFLAMLGADVIHVESPRHPDGIRGHTVLTIEDDQWWEWAPLFHGPNTNKRDVTIDMNSDRGQRLARKLIEQSDVMIENYSPRVMDHWGLGYEAVKELRPDIIFARLPAFGLSGPWRDRTGYAQNMEQVSGMAWMTGFRDGPPTVPNGMCDPLAGTHATVALLLALEHRRRTGHGMLVEVAMVGGALNITAELVVEYEAYGHLMERDGNRGPAAAPQNLYRTSDLLEAWVAIAVETDDQWVALRKAVGDPPWAAAPGLDHVEGRRAAAAAIDAGLDAWCATRSADDIVSTLWPAGVPVGKVLQGGDIGTLPQLQARGFIENVSHPLTGTNLHVGYPVRFSAGPHRMHRRPAPTLGQHNTEILGGLLGLSPSEIDELERDEVIGTRLLGEHRTR